MQSPGRRLQNKGNTSRKTLKWEQMSFG
jgi:hypothetical protein